MSEQDGTTEEQRRHRRGAAAAAAGAAGVAAIAATAATIAGGGPAVHDADEGQVADAAAGAPGTRVVDPFDELVATSDRADAPSTDTASTDTATAHTTAAVPPVAEPTAAAPASVHAGPEPSPLVTGSTDGGVAAVVPTDAPSPTPDLAAELTPPGDADDGAASGVPDPTGVADSTPPASDVPDLAVSDPLMSDPVQPAAGVPALGEPLQAQPEDEGLPIGSPDLMAGVGGAGGGTHFGEGGAGGAGGLSSIGATGGRGFAGDDDGFAVGGIGGHGAADAADVAAVQGGVGGVGGFDEGLPVVPVDLTGHHLGLADDVSSLVDSSVEAGTEAAAQAAAEVPGLFVGGQTFTGTGPSMARDNPDA
ncbi:MAG TPA: hypothetical protein VF855_12035 [Acidimicrobiales bacterium]